MTLRALHIGDLHFWRVPFNPMLLAGKRLLGVGNLVLNRARKFRIRHAPLLAARAAEIEPDWILFSGDFSTTSLDAEFLLARSAFRDLAGQCDGRIHAVPGNHDRYNRAAVRRKSFERHLGAWCSGGAWPTFSEPGEGVLVAGLDATALNGLDSFGRIDAVQVESLRRWWGANGERIGEVWLVCHFPAEDPPGVLPHDRGIQLYEGGLLLDFLREARVPAYYLHGHHHYRWLFRSPTAPNVTYLNAGAPFLRRSTSEPDLGFFELIREDGMTRLALHTCDVRTRMWTAAPVPTSADISYLNLQIPAAGVPVS